MFLDLKKAFDTVDPQILFAYGIRGRILNWFKSYMTGRSQDVAHGGTYSDTKFIRCGVTQGPILGPLLFIIYINDIYNVSQLLVTILYADDTRVLLAGSDLNKLVE